MTSQANEILFGEANNPSNIKIQFFISTVVNLLCIILSLHELFNSTDNHVDIDIAELSIMSTKI